MYKLKRLPKCGREAKQRSEQGERSAERHEPTLAIQSEAALGGGLRVLPVLLIFLYLYPLPPPSINLSARYTQPPYPVSVFPNCNFINQKKDIPICLGVSFFCLKIVNIWFFLLKWGYTFISKSVCITYAQFVNKCFLMSSFDFSISMHPKP